MNGRGQPSTASGRGDLSSAARASGAGLAPEDALIHAYRASEPIDVQPCMCGGYVHANPDAPAKGVQAHNYTGRHRAWRSTRESDSALGTD